MANDNGWRKLHRHYRNARRKANYHKTKPSKRAHKPWTEHDENMIMNPVRIGSCDRVATDREVAQLLGRSVQAIQQRRCLLKNKKNVDKAVS